MSNNIIQQLFKQIESLEKDNLACRRQIEKYEEDMKFVIKTTQFDSWTSFMAWINSQYSDSKQLAVTSHTELPKIQEMSEEHNNSHENDLNEGNSCNKNESQSQEKGSLIDSQILQEAKVSNTVRSIDFMNTGKWETRIDFRDTVSKQVSQASSRNRKSQLEEEFTDFECVVLENANLRKSIQKLQKQLENSRQNVVRLARLLPGEAEVVSQRG